MAAGTLLTVLASIPWGQVVDNAPKIADGAFRLWNAVRGRKTGGDAELADANLTPLESLQVRTAALEEQVRASSDLIKALAEQNAQLVQKMETMRLRLTRFAVAASTVAALLAAALIALALR